MAVTHSPRERVKLYGWGFRQGAGMKAIPEKVREDSDFNQGYSDGRRAFAEAMQKARERFGAPPPSILRVQDMKGQPLTEGDIEAAAEKLMDDKWWEERPFIEVELPKKDQLDVDGILGEDKRFLKELSRGKDQSDDR